VQQNACVRSLPALAASLALLAAGCGGSEPEQQPVEFLEALLSQLYRGEHGAAWETLYGRHQEVATRREYVACEGEAPAFPGRLEQVEVLGSREEQWRVAGEAQPRESTTVTYRVTVSLAGTPERFTGTGHLVAVDGRWRWILNPGDYAAYRAGRCPVTG
jgi:hypothetical protein